MFRSVSLFERRNRMNVETQHTGGTGLGLGSGLHPGGPLTHELGALRNDWWCIFTLGISLVVCGVLAMGMSFFVSVLTVAVFGVLLLAGGIAQILSVFWTGRWSGTLPHLLVGILYAVTGYVLVDAPLQSAVALTLVIACFLLVGGVFRIVAAMLLRSPGWAWVVLNGFISLMLGLLIYKQWPASGLWMIGLFVGIEMLFNGWVWIMLALDLRAVKRTAA
jgi:uncharacterized membrane protein HdeD (DUF308 family)